MVAPRTASLIVVILGGVGVMLGAFLPWATSSGIVSASVSGMHRGDGPFVAGVGVLIVIAGLVLISNAPEPHGMEPRFSFAGIPLGRWIAPAARRLFAAGVGWVDVLKVRNWIAELQTPRPSASASVYRWS